MAGVGRHSGGSPHSHGGGQLFVHTAGLPRPPPVCHHHSYNRRAFCRILFRERRAAKEARRPQSNQRMLGYERWDGWKVACCAPENSLTVMDHRGVLLTFLSHKARHGDLTWRFKMTMTRPTKTPITWNRSLARTSCKWHAHSVHMESLDDSGQAKEVARVHRRCELAGQIHLATWVLCQIQRGWLTTETDAAHVTGKDDHALCFSRPSSVIRFLRRAADGELRTSGCLAGCIKTTKRKILFDISLCQYLIIRGLRLTRERSISTTCLLRP
ncbi:hypothetical protein F5144DRAFT_387170 [Chaetomium tenue]|uniref:Uncharacterized protein n=1 Tax=Chaetomium tenue TaxID=1854479 RepID=A0ACB7P0A8_9PEZI|nr:hypothetical protein F5144DRAFT_387170 [Chaetomium globosum]